jgi:hypothetical protein
LVRDRVDKEILLDLTDAMQEQVLPRRRACFSLEDPKWKISD